MDDGRQGELALVEHDFNATPISQRSSDGYINATAMCKAAGKRWGHYQENATTKAFVSALASDIGIPTSQLIQSIRGGRIEDRGTYVHPQVAVHLAQWLSPEFAVQVSKWVFEWLSGKTEDNRPYKFARRAAMAARNVPHGYFSVIREMMMRLHTDLEFIGYEIPDYAANGKEIQPDISLGIGFSKWLKKNRPDLIEKKIEYPHEYEDQRGTRNAAAYPNSMLQLFFDYLYQEWVPNNFPGYIKSRDPEALPIIQQMLPELLAPPK